MLNCTATPHRSTHAVDKLQLSGDEEHVLEWVLSSMYTSSHPHTSLQLARLGDGDAGRRPATA